MHGSTQLISTHNIPIYGRALAYSHIEEARPILKRLFNEIKKLDREEYKEKEAIYNDPSVYLEGFLYDSIDGYLNNQEEQDGYWDYDDDDYDEDEDGELPF